MQNKMKKKPMHPANGGQKMPMSPKQVEQMMEKMGGKMNPKKRRKGSR